MYTFFCYGQFIPFYAIKGYFRTKQKRVPRVIMARAYDIYFPRPHWRSTLYSILYYYCVFAFFSQRLCTNPDVRLKKWSLLQSTFLSFYPLHFLNFFSSKWLSESHQTNYWIIILKYLTCCALICLEAKNVQKFWWKNKIQPSFLMRFSRLL